MTLSRNTMKEIFKHVESFNGGPCFVPSCEKCWADSGGDFHRYLEIFEERGGQCAPEEQAGDDAKICDRCGRKTVHQCCNECLACDR
ncbi:MAG: hypothetical protein ACYTFK_13605 [Planctomycetota bacterium]